MINKNRILKLENGEEIHIICENESIKVRNDKNKLLVKKVQSSNINPNIEIVNLDFDELKRFVLLEQYYQNIMSLDVDDYIKQEINKFLDYHFNIIYGKAFNEDIIKNEYQSIIYYQ